MKVHSKKRSSKRLLVTIITTTLLTSTIVFGLIYQFRPQSPGEDISNFFYKIPGTKSLSMAQLNQQGSSSSTKLPKSNSKQDLTQASKDLDSLNIDNFDASISQNDQ